MLSPPKVAAVSLYVTSTLIHSHRGTNPPSQKVLHQLLSICMSSSEDDSDNEWFKGDK